MSIMPPEGIAEFAAPVTQNISITTTNQQLVGLDPTRVLLIIGTFSGNFAVSPLSTLGASQGIGVNSNNPVLVFTWADHGPLVTLPWYAIGTGPATALLITMSYRPTVHQQRNNLADWIDFLKSMKEGIAK